MAADSDNNAVLVRILPDFERIIAEEALMKRDDIRHVDTSQNSIHSCGVGASIWIPNSAIKLVAAPASVESRALLSAVVIPKPAVFKRKLAAKDAILEYDDVFAF